MEMKIKVKKGTIYMFDANKQVLEYIHKKTTKLFYSKKKKHYVEELQTDIIIEIEVKKVKK